MNDWHSIIAAHRAGDMPDEAYHDWLEEHPEIAEVLKHWPEAVWMLGDRPPVGEWVLNNHHRCKVVGMIEPGAVRMIEPGTMQKSCHCATCDCEEPAHFQGWWIVFDQEFRLEILAYPPALRPLEVK